MTRATIKILLSGRICRIK